MGKGNARQVCAKRPRVTTWRLSLCCREGDLIDLFSDPSPSSGDSVWREDEAGKKMKAATNEQVVKYIILPGPMLAADLLYGNRLPI